jgi:hypothetical protein
MTQVCIIFDGSLVVGPAFSKQSPSKKKGPLFAVLPYSPRQRSRRSEDQSCPEYISAHLPGIFTKMESQGRNPDLCYKGYSLWCPLRERMQFVIDGKTKPGTLEYDYNPVSGGNSRTRIGDVTMLSDMRDIWPARRRLRHGMLSPWGCVSTRVAAQVFVPRGKVNSGSAHKPVWATFDPPKEKTVTKYIVSQVIVTVEASSKLELSMCSLDTGEKLDSIRFSLNSEKATIWIANGDLRNFPYAIDHLLNQASTEPSKENVAVDFELIYSVLGGHDSGGLPIPCGERLGQRPCYTSLVDP